jgi:hypothetical protein
MSKLESEVDQLRWEVVELKRTVETMRTAGMFGDSRLRKVIDEQVHKKFMEWLMGFLLCLALVLYFVTVVFDSQK